MTPNDEAWFAASSTFVDAAWIEHHGHVHLPFYTVIFTDAISATMNRLGIGETYAALGQGTFFGAENHVRYLRELKAGDQLCIEVCLLDRDTKRLHWRARMSKGNGMVAATFELLSVHVDQRTRRTTPMSDEVYAMVRELPGRSGETHLRAQAWQLGAQRGSER